MNFLNDLRKFLDKYYVKLPAFPKGLNDFIVSVAPWLALIFGVLAIIAGVQAFGVFSVTAPLAAYAGLQGYTFIAIVTAVILFLQGLIGLLAFSPLKAKKVKGWNLMFYSLLLGLLSPIITLNTYSILNALVGVLIGYYVLYQVRAFYK